nr:reverse transcriptase domain-containing protein [Tanacetum cinerariifolium]
MPINVKMYDGTRDPDDHLKIFQAAEKIKRELLAAKEIHKRSCRNPPHQAEGGRVNGRFHENIQGGKYACQRSTKIHEDIDIHAWNHQSGSNQKLNDNIPKSMDEIMSVTTAFLRRKVAAANQSKKKAPPTWKHHGSGHRLNFDKRLNFKNQHKSSRRQDRFIPLTKTPKEILTMDTVKFKAPPPMTGPAENHNKNELCEFHKDKGDDNGQETLIVIEAEVEGHLIHHMYVDGGSASEVLYEQYFNRLHLKIKNQMIPATTPLLGFSGEMSCPLGQISLMVTLGDEEHSAVALMNFMIVRSQSPYNGIIGRTSLKKIQAVLSTAHGMLKFPVERGIATIRSTTIMAAKCMMVTQAQSTSSPKEPAAAEGIKIAIHPELNVREGCPPIRQKRRGHAPDRNKAIQEEVSKLVQTEITREVSWSENKKEDALSKIASTSLAHLTKQVLVETLKRKSIEEREIIAIVEEEEEEYCWMTQLVEYLTEGILSAETKKAPAIKIKARQYTMINGVLYRKSFLEPWLRCVGPMQAVYVVKEIHEGSCSMHSGPRFVVAKAIRSGYYWPTMHKDARNIIRACSNSQTHKPVPRNPQQKLTPITSPWPFYK